MKVLIGILSVFMSVVISVTTAFCVSFNKNKEFKDIVTQELESSSLVKSLEEESLKIDECENKINELKNQLSELDEKQVEERKELEQQISNLEDELNLHISNYDTLLTRFNSLSSTVSNLSSTVNNLLKIKKVSGFSNIVSTSRANDLNLAFQIISEDNYTVTAIKTIKDLSTGESTTEDYSLVLFSAGTTYTFYPTSKTAFESGNYIISITHNINNYSLKTGRIMITYSSKSTNSTTETYLYYSVTITSAVFGMYKYYI